MPARDLPARPNIEQYKKQAKDLLKSCKSRDPEAIRRLREFVRHEEGPSKPGRAGSIRLADAQFVIAREHGFDSWPKLAKEIATRTGASSLAAIWRSAEEAVVAGDVSSLARLLRGHEQMFRSQRPQSSWLGGLTPDYSAADARSIIVRNHGFESWDQFAAYTDAVKNPTSPIARFEAAVDAIVAGDVVGLQRLLQQDPDLVRARSTRTHHSTLLHYVGANGVEGFRQRTPKSAVQIAETLLNAGAEVDAVADMYEGGCTTLGLVATSIHPKVAGLLIPLIDTLIAHGARIDVPGSGRGHLLVNGCLANGRPAAAELLASRGAPLDLEGAAGLGQIDLVRMFFDADGRLKSTATTKQMKDGMAWACEYGRTEVIGFLLDHGIGVGERLRPHGQTGLHWAAHGGYVDAVKVLLTRHAPVDVKDESFDGTPLDWALHGWTEAATKDSYYQVVALLVAAGAPVQPEWLNEENARTNPRMVAALTGKTPDA
jgi:ankyrin repeat protein